MKITLITLMNNPNNPKTSNPNLTTLLTNTTQSVRDGFPEENDPSKRSLESLVEEERGGGERRGEKLRTGETRVKRVGKRGEERSWETGRARVRVIVLGGQREEKR